MERLGRALAALAGRFLPRPFVPALPLSLVAMAAALPALPGGLWSTRLPRLLASWPDGFADGGFPAFALQMCLILVTGYALAGAPPVRRAIARVAPLPRAPAGAAAPLNLAALRPG